MKNKKSLSRVACALVALFGAQLVYASGNSVFLADWTAGYGSPYPELPKLPENFSKNDPNVTPIVLDEKNVVITSDDEKKIKTYSAKFSLPTNLKNKYGVTLDSTQYSGELIGTKSLQTGRTQWEIKISGVSHDPTSGFNGKDWFQEPRLMTSDNPNIYARTHFWEMTVPIQYRVMMQVDGQDSEINFKDYHHTSPIGTRVSEFFTEFLTKQRASFSSTDQHEWDSQGIPFRLNSFFTKNTVTDLGDTKLSINTYYNVAGTLREKKNAEKTQWMVVSDLDFTEFKNTQHIKKDLVNKGAIGFMGEPVKSGMYIANTTIDLNKINQLPGLIQHYRPIQGMFYETTKDEGFHTLKIEMKASYWSPTLQYYPTTGGLTRPMTSKLETSKAQMFLTVPNTF